MAKFVQGQVVSADKLNQIDILINDLRIGPTTSKVNNLIETWDNLYSGGPEDKDNQISDEIKAIQEKINEYIK